MFVFTALLKVIGFRPSITAPPNLASPWLKALVIQEEVFLGVWLLSGFRRGAAWICTFATLVVFGVVSLGAGLSGQRDCGCLGPLPGNPWYMFMVDVGAVGLLLWFNPQRWSVAAASPTLSYRTNEDPWRLGACLAGVFLTLLVVSLASESYFGSLKTTLVRLRGATIASPHAIESREKEPMK